MKKFDLPVVELIAFQSEDIICTSGAGTFLGDNTDISWIVPGDGPIELPIDPAYPQS